MNPPKYILFPIYDRIANIRRGLLLIDILAGLATLGVIIGLIAGILARKKRQPSKKKFLVAGVCFILMITFAQFTDSTKEQAKGEPMEKPDEQPVVKIAKDEVEEEVKDEEPKKANISTYVFEYAQKVEVIDAIELNDHVTVFIDMSSGPTPGLATQQVVNQTYDFIQQDDLAGAKTVSINVRQKGNKIAMFTVDMSKFVPNDDEPMAQAVIAASDVEFMTDEVKEFGKVIDSW